MDDSFDVRLVRARQTRFAALGRPSSAALQALKRPLRLRVLPNELRLSLAAAPAEEESSSTSTIMRFFAAPTPAGQNSGGSVWLSVRMAQVKSVRVKKRLLQVALHDDQALTLCMKSASEALDAATTMMHAWGVEPLVETKKAEARAPLTLEQLTALFLDNHHFRSLVHQMHARIASLEIEADDDGDDGDGGGCLLSTATRLLHR